MEIVLDDFFFVIAQGPMMEGAEISRNGKDFVIVGMAGVDNKVKVAGKLLVEVLSEGANDRAIFPFPDVLLDLPHTGMDHVKGGRLLSRQDVALDLHDFEEVHKVRDQLKVGLLHLLEVLLPTTYVDHLVDSVLVLGMDLHEPLAHKPVRPPAGRTALLDGEATDLGELNLWHHTVAKLSNKFSEVLKDLEEHVFRFL